MSFLHLLYILICSFSFAAMDLLRKMLAGSIAPMAVVFCLALVMGLVGKALFPGGYRALERTSISVPLSMPTE